MTRALVLRIAALGALTVVLGARAIDSDVYEGGEAREALVAREMLDTGDWILPLWNGSVVPSKPPLFHWLVASSARLTGGQVTVRTLRAPSVVLGGVVVVVVFLAGLAWGGAEVGTFAALVLVTTPQFLTEASDGRVDMTLTAAVTGAQVAVVQALGVRRGARLVLALCLAFAMLAKGPIGPGLVGLTALAFAARERQLRPVLGLVRPLPVLLFVVVAGGWYALAYAHRGMDFVAKQILSENGEALLGSSRFPYRSPLYYVALLVLGGFPWTLVVPWAAARAWGGERPRRYAVVWAATVFIFFSIAPLKRAAYLLPLRPALALVVGWWLAEAAREAEPATRLSGAARTLAHAVTAGALLAAASAIAVGHGLVSTASIRDVALRYEIDVDAYARTIAARQLEIVALALAAALAGAHAARALGRARWRRATFATAAAVAGVALLALGVFVPARAAQKSIRPFALAVRARLQPTDRLSLFTGEEEIPFIFYVGRRVRLASGRPVELAPGYYVLDQERWGAWGRRPGWEEVLRSAHVFSRHRRDLVLVRRR
ncbi:MAG: hypothetical protein E6J75_01955 [Deltaproteobacteria bacterium]|nr:MAG: hypothetical protein E6J75_01955 [Deltaproteobacteria bacterium]